MEILNYVVLAAFIIVLISISFKFKIKFEGEGEMSVKVLIRKLKDWIGKKK